MKIVLWLLIFSVFLLQSCTQLSTEKFEHNLIKADADNKPANVIVIVADQMRRASMGFWREATYQGALNGTSDYVITPNLDALAEQGAVFTDAISNYPLCSPFRGMLLSGLFPHKNGVTNNTKIGRRNVGLKTDIISLTESLASAGYNTALVGKGHWHTNLPLFDDKNRYVGSEKAPGGHHLTATKFDTYIPPGSARQGIEYWYQTIGHNHANPIVYTNDLALSKTPEGHPYHPKRYSAVDQADVIIDYIKNTRAQRQVAKPFSILWTMDPPHTPYKALKDTDEAIFNQYYKNIAIETLLNRPNVDVKKAEQYARYHFSMITLIDREIGRIVNTLKAQGLDKNTLIVFTADHGEMMGSHSKMTKNYVYEESLSIPFIVNFPGKVNQQINDLLIGVPDFMPTILGLLSLDNYIPNDLDGKNYAPLILKPEARQLVRPQSSLYYGKDNEFGVRTHQYTYAINANGELIALFDNQKDPYQLTMLNFADIPVEDGIFLKQQLGQWLKNIDHPWFMARKHPQMIDYPR